MVTPWCGNDWTDFLASLDYRSLFLFQEDVEDLETTLKWWFSPGGPGESAGITSLHLTVLTGQVNHWYGYKMAAIDHKSRKGWEGRIIKGPIFRQLPLECSNEVPGRQAVPHGSHPSGESVLTTLIRQMRGGANLNGCLRYPGLEGWREHLVCQWIF